MQVNEYQKELQALQRSPEGYSLAGYLLQQNSKNCKYFGALTYAVVIRSSNDLDEGRIKELVYVLHSNIKQLAADPSQIRGNLFIIRKLMSDLSLLYVKYHNYYVSPIWLFIEALGSNHGSDPQEFAFAVSQLPSLLFALLLILFTVLIEDVVKFNDYKSSVHAALHRDVFPLLVVIYEYILYLSENNQLDQELDSQALTTLNSWMQYIANANGDTKYNETQVSCFIRYLFIHFQTGVDVNQPDLISSAHQSFLIFDEILEINPTLLSMELKLSLYRVLFDNNQWGQEFMERVIFTDLKEEYSDEINAFVELVLVVLQLNSVRLSKTILEGTTQNILSIAHRLTAMTGPYEDENISGRMLVFWEELANVYQDSSDVFEAMFESQSDTEFKIRFEGEKTRILNEVARVYWKKLHLPDLPTYTSIKADFNSYRSSVADFFLVMYSLEKAPFYEVMVDSLIENINQLPSDPLVIADIEATLFLLFKINEDLVYFESQANALFPLSLRVFQNGIIGAFQHLPLNDPANAVFYATNVQYLASNEFFFKTAEGSVYLGALFDLLFPIIMSDSRILSLLASKTALTICDVCSNNLAGFLPNLEIIVIEMLKNPSIDSLIRLRMFKAFTVIARSIPLPQEHGRIVSGLITGVRDAGDAMMGAAGESLSDIQEEYLISLLSCLVNIAKGCALPDDTIEEVLIHQEQAYKEYWQEDPMGIKEHIYSIIEKFSLQYPPLFQKTLVVERCTLVLKNGLGEKLGGPFDLGDDAIAHYIISLMSIISNPNAVSYAFALIETLVSVNYREIDAYLVHELIEKAFTQRLDFLKTDPDMIESAIGVFSKIIECKPALILHTEVFSNTVVGFALDGLNASELLTVKSILKFWIGFLNMKRGTKEDQDRANEMFVGQNLGKLVTANLLLSFLKAPRSNLEYYYSVFRGLVARYPMQCKIWLVEALNDATEINRSKVTDKDLEMFVHKLLITRGRRTANEVLKSFWLQVNGFFEYNTVTF